MSRAAGELKSPINIGLPADGWDAGLRYPLVRGPCRGLLKRALQELKSSGVDSPLPEASSQRGESPFGAGFRAAVSPGWLPRQCWCGAVSPRGAPLCACGPASSCASSYVSIPFSSPSWAGLLGSCVGFHHTHKKSWLHAEVLYWSFEGSGCRHLVSFLGHAVIMLRSCRSHVEVMLEMFRGRFGVMLKIVLGLFWSRSRVILM